MTAGSVPFDASRPHVARAYRGEGSRRTAARDPTLVADGTLDELDPVTNDRLLADSVAGAELILYPGTGHAFLFQDLASFVSAVKRFLA